MSATSYKRYEKDGLVPRPLVKPVAKVIGLEVEEPDPIKVKLYGSALMGSEHRRLVDVLDSLGQATRDLVALLAEQRQVVERLENVAAVLQQREAAKP